MHALRITSGLAVGAAIIVSAFVAPAAVPGIAPGATSVHFTASGDFGTSASAQAVFAGIGAAHPDLHLAVGDLFYGPTGQEQTWCDLVTQGVGAGFPFELVSGNHESNGQNGNINDFSACLPNQLPGAVGTYGRQYYVDVPQDAPLVRFVMISPALPFSDGTWSYASGTPRYNWTAAAIDGARAASIPWVVVGMHKPCLSMGEYACDPGADLLNLLVNKQVDLVLTGHEHLYQRTHQLTTGSGCPAIVPGTFTSACLADTDNTMAKGAGTVFATVGTGGNGNYDVNPADSESNYFAAKAGASANPVYGSLDVTATATQLTASFARAAGASFADSFTVGPEVWNGNKPPNASFTSACTNLACTFDGSGSSDLDGTVASYAWDFGDGASGTGTTPPHTYAAAGIYTARLTVTDNGGATGTTTRTVNVSGNLPPNATFTSACSDLACTFTGSASSDPDGTVASYAWDFGDGASATGATPAHTYASAGSYTVRLTVTDNGGSTGTTTRTVTVTAPPTAGVLASDTFDRAVSGGWGTAPTGGPWTFAGSSSRYLVSGGVGSIQLPAGSGGSTYLTSVSSAATDLRMKIGVDEMPSSGSVYLSISGRRIATTGSYQSKVIISSAGKLTIWIVRVNPTGGAEIVLQTGVAVPGTFTVGSKVAIRVKVTGTSPTLIETRAWLDGTPEPTTWQRSITDSTPELQAPGGIGITGYLSGGVANAPVTMTVDDLSAVVP
jgi:PKD repeat protein